MIFGIITGLLGIYCIFTGIKTIMTGNISVAEAKRLEGFSKKGAKTYKLIYSLMNIFGGLAVIVFGVLKILEEQKIIEDTLIFRIVILGVAVLMAIGLVIAKKKCKQMTDDE